MKTRHGQSAEVAFGLRGRVVTMDSTYAVHQDATVYVAGNRISAVVPAGTAPPAQLAAAKVHAVRGTILPGLIELHNHLPYNVIGLWVPPQKYKNRGKWRGAQEYDRALKAPMEVVTAYPELTASVARWVECKLLASGVTTSQGIALMKAPKVRRYLRGIVRNVESGGSPKFPSASTNVADVLPGGAEAFLRKLKKEKTCYLFHLSEGTDTDARQFFLNLKVGNASWAITSVLAGIHATALRRADFDVLAASGASVVWSPMSNLVLYGDTTEVKSAKAAGVRFALGADWSFTGSKNLLGELKVARAVSMAKGGVFSDRDLVAMVTREAAAILGWQAVVGSIEVKKRADLVVIAGKTGDPYDALVSAGEPEVRLVLVDGVVRYGVPGLVKALGVSGEAFRAAGGHRRFFLQDPTADTLVAAITLAEAKATLTKALSGMGTLADSVARSSAARRSAFEKLIAGRGVHRAAVVPRRAPAWRLVLDEPGGPHPASALGARAAPTPGWAMRPLAARLAEPRMRLDPLTVRDDSRWLDQVRAQPNIPTGIRHAIVAAFE